MTEWEKLEKDAKRYRELYTDGTRIVLIKMNDPYAPVPAGTRGTLESVDDLSQFQMKWDNGRTLALVPQHDQFRTLTAEEQAEEERLGEFADSVVATMKPGHAAQTFIMCDLAHGINIFVDESCAPDDVHYVIEPCDYDCGMNRLTLMQNASSTTATYGDVKALFQQCLWVIANYFPESGN